MLQAKAQYTLTELIECAHPKRSALQQSGTEGDDPALDLEREEIARLTTHVLSDIRNLLHSVGIQDHSLSAGPSSRSVMNENTQRAVQLRPFTKKVTSPLSKLVLSVRAVWGLLGTSIEEEQRTQEQLLEAESEDILLALRDHRAQTVSRRTEGERRLRLDIVVGAREVSEALTTFVEKASESLLELQSPSHDFSRITAQRRTEGILRSNVAALLAPGGGYGASWRGNGLSVLPSHQPNHLPGSVPVPNVRYTYPRRKLDEDAVTQLSGLGSKLVSESNNLHDLVVLQQLQQQASTNKRASGTSVKSHLSDRSIGALSLRSTTSPNLSTSSGFARLSKLTLQANALLSALSSLLSFAEDIDIAAAVDVDVDPSSVRSLLSYQNSITDHDKQDTASTVCDAPKNYKASLIQARKQLAELAQAKQDLYDSMSSLAASLQSLSMGQELQRSPTEMQSSLSQSQPPSTAPLSEFAVPEQAADPFSDLLISLASIRNGKTALEDTFRALQAVAGDQAQAPEDLRTASQDQRVRLNAHRLSQASFASSVRSSASSFKGAHGNISQTQRSLSILPLASDLVAAGPRSGTALGDPFSSEARGHANRLSIADSIASSNMSNISGQSQNSLLRSQTRLSGPRTSVTDLAYAQASPSRSPSTNKIRKFFGDDAPISTFSPTAQAGSSPRGEAKIKKFFGDDAPPTMSTDRGPSPATDKNPWFLQSDFTDEIAVGADGTVRGGTLRALVARLTPHDTGQRPSLYEIRNTEPRLQWIRRSLQSFCLPTEVSLAREISSIIWSNATPHYRHPD